MRVVPGLQAHHVKAISNTGYVDGETSFDRAHQCRVEKATMSLRNLGRGNWKLEALCRGITAGSMYTVKCRGTGCKVTGSGCNCLDSHKRGNGCKHVCAVLLEVVDYEEEARIAKAEVRKKKKCGVYVALKAFSDSDSGSDYRFSGMHKENYNFEVLGIYFNLKNANQRAHEEVTKIAGYDENGEDDDEDENEGTELYSWEDDRPPDDAFSGVPRVWVEHRAVEDPSRRFHV